jgi:hypothetical protein
VTIQQPRQAGIGEVGELAAILPGLADLEMPAVRLTRRAEV